MSSTLYILAGGCDRRYESYGDELAAIVTAWKPSPKILNCFFSQDPLVWSEKALEWSAWIAKYFGSDVEQQVASVEDFRSQVAWADVVYLRGGETKRLIETLAPFEDTKAMFEGKVVIGSSAGANYLSRAFYSPSKDIIGIGIGIVPTSVVVHYGIDDFEGKKMTQSDWRTVVERVGDKTQPGDAITLLPEGKFSLFVVS